MTESGMSHNRYEIVIRWSNEDNAFIAEIPELAGCAADGATYSEAIANIRTVSSEWFKTAKELGRTLPEPARLSDRLSTNGIEWTKLAESSLEFWLDEKENVYADLAKSPARKMWLDYDDAVDVLYVHFEETPASDHSEMGDDGIILDYRDQNLVGLTILDASQR